MRIEHAGTIKNIPENARSQELIQGDILIAEVTGVDGDKVILKSQDGMALTAKLINDIFVSVGDFVETVVDKSGHGRYVLRIVDITRNRTNNDSGGTDMQAIRSDSGTARTLRDTLNIMKMNPGTTPKVAAFLSRHEIYGTLENIDTVTQLSKSANPIGKLLAEIMSLIKQEANSNNASALAAGFETVPVKDENSNQPVENTQIADTENENLNSISENKAEAADTAAQNLQSADYAKSVYTAEKPSLAEHTVKAGALDIFNVLYHSEQYAEFTDNKLTVQHKTQNPQINNEADAINLKDEDATVIKADINAAENSNTVKIAPDDGNADISPKNLDTAAVRQKTEGLESDSVLNTNNTKADINTSLTLSEQSENDAETAQILSEKIASMFVKLSDKDKLAANVKRAVKELSEDIKELKLLISSHDTNNKDVLVRKLESAEKQLSLLSQIRHFDFFCIPLVRADGSNATAELYVYRNRKKRKAEEAESFTILLGLDTQHLGRVETLIKASGIVLSVVLHMEDINFADEIDGDIKLFKDSAERFGYKTVNVTIEKLASKTTILNSEERLTLKPGGSPGVDIRI